ncbi:MAG: ATP synthase F1 subunit epsilon, partial [Phycisphaerae bacterium]
MPITVQILTPDGLVFEALDATFVAASGEGGDLGIETNHSNLLTTLRIGPLRIRTAGGEHPFAVHGGFLEATPEAVRIVADAAEPADAIDTERARTCARSTGFIPRSSTAGRRTGSSKGRWCSTGPR